MSYDREADHNRRFELAPIATALMIHLHNHDGAAVRDLLEQDGFFDSPDQARQFIMAMGDVILNLLTLAMRGDQDEVARLLRVYLDVNHKI